MKIQRKELSKYLIQKATINRNNLYHLDNYYQGFICDMSDNQIIKLYLELNKPSLDNPNLTFPSPYEMYLLFGEVFVFIPLKKDDTSCFIFTAEQIGYDFTVNILKQLISSES